MNINRGLFEQDVRWQPPRSTDALPRRPARRTSMTKGQPVGRWRSDGDLSGMFPPLAPSRKRGGDGIDDAGRWSSHSHVPRSDSLPYQPRRDSNFSAESIDSSLFGCVSSLASSGMHSRCSNVSVTSTDYLETPRVIAFPVTRKKPHHVPRRGVSKNLSSSQQSATSSSRVDSDYGLDKKTPTKLVLKLNSEASRNRKVSRSRSGQSTLSSISAAASERRMRSLDGVEISDDTEPNRKQSNVDLFASMEAKAAECLQQLMIGSEGSDADCRSRPERARVA